MRRSGGRAPHRSVLAAVSTAVCASVTLVLLLAPAGHSAIRWGSVEAETIAWADGTLPDSAALPAGTPAKRLKHLPTGPAGVETVALLPTGSHFILGAPLNTNSLTVNGATIAHVTVAYAPTPRCRADLVMWRDGYPLYTASMSMLSGTRYSLNDLFQGQPADVYGYRLAMFQVSNLASGSDVFAIRIENWAPKVCHRVGIDAAGLAGW